MGQTNEQQRHFNEWPIIELQGEADSIQTIKTTFYQTPAIMECRLYLSAQNCNQKMFGCIFLPPVALMSAGVIK